MNVRIIECELTVINLVRKYSSTIKMDYLVDKFYVSRISFNVNCTIKFIIK